MASPNWKASADLALSWPELSFGRDVCTETISGFSIRLGEVGLSREGMEAVVRKDLIMWEKVLSSFYKCNAFLMELRLQPFGRLAIICQLETGDSKIWPKVCQGVSVGIKLQ